MKKLLVLILSVLLGLGALAACGGDTDDSSSPVVTYDITYSAVIDDVKQEVPAAAWKQNGKYPESYEKGKIAPIDNLNTYDVVTETAEGKVLFQGWFTDEACTVSFTGIIAGTRGDQALYAKFTTDLDPREYSVSYYVVEGGVTTALAADSTYRVSGAEYPTSYYYGSVVTVDSLVSFFDKDDTKYAIGCWYTDEDCETAFAGITVETVGDLKLYAKISEAVQRTITLKGVIGSQEVEIPEQMKRKDGNYPSTYYEGIGAQVDTLKDYEDRNNEWRFLGWYTDKACTEKFEGTIDITQTGDVTLYAKLYYAAWTDPV